MWKKLLRHIKPFFSQTHILKGSISITLNVKSKLKVMLEEKHNKFNDEHKLAIRTINLVRYRNSQWKLHEIYQFRDYSRFQQLLHDFPFPSTVNTELLRDFSNFPPSHSHNWIRRKVSSFTIICKCFRVWSNTRLSVCSSARPKLSFLAHLLMKFSPYSIRLFICLSNGWS